MPYIHFTEEQKLRASEVDLVEFLRCQGEKLIRSGPEYRLDRDHSVTVRGNGWYDHAAKEGGGPISFVQQFYNLSYPEAITCLLGGEQGVVYASAPKQEEEPKAEFALPPANRDMRRMYAYLLKHRLLNRDVINTFVRAGLLYESCEKSKDMTREYHNAVFVGKDENGVARHAHKRSLNNLGKTFRINVESSDPRCSFHYTGTSDRLYVFEAPIDLMSFLSRYPRGWQEHSYVSLCGTSEHAMLWMLEQNPSIHSVCLCLDHDEAGIEASGRLAEILHEHGYTTYSTQGVAFQVPSDWTQAEGTNLFYATGRPEVYGLNGASPLGSYEPQEFYKALVEHYEETNQFSDLQAAESVSAWQSADGVECWAADFTGYQDSIIYCTKLIVAPQKNLVLTFCGQANAETVAAPTQVWGTLNFLCESLTFEIGTADEIMGNTFLCGDGSQLCLQDGGDFRWYQSAEDHESPYYEGVYEVYREQAAMDKAASMTEYGLTMEDLERVLSASMNGYIPGESRPIDYLYSMGELEDDRERYQVCLDTFYAVILHNQRLVSSPEEVREGGNSTLYIGFYLPELEMADLTNCNAGSNTQWTFQEKTA